MNLEVWYSLSQLPLSDLEKLEHIINSRPYKHRLKLLFKPIHDTACPHQKAAYVFLKWAEKEYLGLIVLKRLLALGHFEKSDLMKMGKDLGLCQTQVSDVLCSEDYEADLSIDFSESQSFFIDRPTLMIGENRVISLSQDADNIAGFIDYAYAVHTKTIKKCDPKQYCSDEQCQFHYQGVQIIKCK